MTWIRRVALAFLLMAAVAVVAVTAVEFWNHREFDSSSLRSAPASSLDDRARLLQDRVETLARRVGDMQVLVLVLLGTSGLYAIVFVVTSYLSATSFARQADHAIDHIKDEIGVALGDLRQLQEETQQKLDEAPAGTAAKLEAPRTDLRTMIQAEVAAHFKPSLEPEAQVAAISKRISSVTLERLDAQARLELLHFENAAACLELSAGPEVAPALAALYRKFARLYGANDRIRSRFYLTRGLSLAAPDSTLASDLHYDLACWFAQARDFTQAMQELKAAFQNQSKVLYDRLATDIDQAGDLYELAATPPFDKALNDILLNVNVP